MRRMVLGVMVFHVLAISSNAQLSSHDFNTLTVLAALSESNTAKFPSGVMTFEFTDAYTLSLDDAISGTIMNPESTVGRYVFSGDDALYVCEFDRLSVLRRSKRLAKNTSSTTLNSIRLLTNGALTLSDQQVGDDTGEINRAVIILAGNKAFYSQAYVPLNLGFPEEFQGSLSYFARKIAGHDLDVKLVSVGNESAGWKANTIRIEVASSLGRRVMWVDPERGGIVIHTHDEMKQGKTTYDLVCSDLREVPNAGWFPFLQTIVLNGTRVKRVKVIDIRNETLPASRFRLEFPKPTPIVNLAKNISYPPKSTWELRNLPRPDSKGVEALPRPLASVHINQLSEPRTTNHWHYVLGSVAALFIGSCVYIWRKRHRCV